MVNKSLNVIYAWTIFSQLPKYQAMSCDKCISVVILDVFCVIQLILASIFSWLSCLLPFHHPAPSPPVFFSPPLHRGLLGLHTAHSQSAHQVRYTHKHSHTHIHAPRHSMAPCSTAGRLRLSVRASPKTYPEQQ